MSGSSTAITSVDCRATTPTGGSSTGPAGTGRPWSRSSSSPAARYPIFSAATATLERETGASSHRGWSSPTPTTAKSSGTRYPASAASPITCHPNQSLDASSPVRRGRAASHARNPQAGSTSRRSSPR